MEVLSTVKNAFTIDVEDYFQVEAFRNIIKPEQWGGNKYPSRVVASTHRILERLDTHDVKATFFILGWVAERHPSLVHEIANRGHELACHGFAHQRATSQNQDEFFNDVSRAKHLLEDLSGAQVNGYRAPSFSINPSNQWAFGALAEAGFCYSSSTYPVKHDLYGAPTWPRFAYYRPEGILEIPVPTLRYFGRNFPIGGGGYFRLQPYSVSRALINRYLKAEQQPYLFYFHPWEIDPLQPRIENAAFKSKIRHYINLDRMEHKVDQLLTHFQWSTMKDVYQIQGQKSVKSIRA